MKNLIEYIDKYMRYDPYTGHVYWKEKVPSNRVTPHSRVGHYNKASGYLSVRILGKLYQLHRIIWLHMMGEFPKFVDHKNGDRLDNSWKNLRAATRSQNNANNKRLRPHKYKGVTFQKGKWKAQCRGHLGMFPSIEEAALAYDKKASEVFGEFAVLNFPKGDLPSS